MTRFLNRQTYSVVAAVIWAQLYWHNAHAPTFTAATNAAIFPGGPREGHVVWTTSSIKSNADGNGSSVQYSWLFGGWGLDQAGDFGRLNDLWRTDGITGWAQVGGAMTADPDGMYLRDNSVQLDELVEIYCFAPVTVRAANSRGPRGPVGPLCTPFRTPGILSGPSIAH